MTQELLEKAWREVGRFIWAFTNVERDVDQLLVRLFQLNRVSEELFLNSLDFRKKINIVKIALQRQSIKHSLSSLHEQFDLRNHIAHKVFLVDHRGEGISFTWASIERKVTYPSLSFSFEELERRYFTLRTISDELDDIARSCKPLGEDDQVAVVEEASNVVPFPK